LSEYLTVAEAASLLKVHKSTIWRWIDKGQLPVYRVGQRGVRLKKADLERSLTPVSPEKGGTMAKHEQVRERRLTKAEQQRGLRALENLDRLRAELLQERGGKLFPDSAAELRQEREKRTQELMARHAVAP
jgi:excisionase family DNA binding protein